MCQFGILSFTYIYTHILEYIHVCIYLYKMKKIFPNRVNTISFCINVLMVLTSCSPWKICDCYYTEKLFFSVLSFLSHFHLFIFFPFKQE